LAVIFQILNEIIVMKDNQGRVNSNTEYIKSPAIDANGFIRAPNDLMDYLIAGCQVKQLGHLQRRHNDLPIQYFLIPGDETWEVKVPPHHFEALVTREKVFLAKNYGNGISTWLTRLGDSKGIESPVAQVQRFNCTEVAS